MKNNSIKFIYFGSSAFSVLILNELEKAGFLPTSIVTTPDKPQGRKMVISPTPVKTWGLGKNIPVHTPDKLDDDFMEFLKEQSADVYIVASYGKIIPDKIINIPPKKTLNVHPSLLPKYRGPSPLQSAMIDDVKNTGVTIMRIDEQMDHGPLVAQRDVPVAEWPPYEEFEELMALEGGKLLAEILPDWVSGKIKEKEQDHEAATYTEKINKEDACLDFDDDDYLNFRKVQAYSRWPIAYFYIRHQGKEIRVKITQASYKNNRLNIEKVIPEGGKEISSEDFYRGYKK